jgi:UDP-glucose 4-epimerase
VFDINNKDKLDALFKKYNFFAVLHLAAFKSVGESCEKPLKYYNNNVSGTINVLEVNICIKD